MMSHIEENKAPKMTIPKLLEYKKNGQKISMTTCYDSSFAKLVDRCHVDAILVGDSLGNVMLGYDNTIEVTLKDMIHHTKAVTRSCKSKLIIADMPFGTYTNSQQACKNAVSLMQKSGCHAVKLEGPCSEIIQTIVQNGIPVVGHLGLTPQSIHQLGGYKVQGKDQNSSDAMIKAAIEIESAGASALVLEMVPSILAKKISQQLNIPTIGIGAGKDCDGQVLVLQDMLGFDSSFNPKFLKKYLNMDELIIKALNEYNSEVKENTFPSENNTYTSSK